MSIRILLRSTHPLAVAPGTLVLLALLLQPTRPAAAVAATSEVEDEVALATPTVTEAATVSDEIVVTAEHVLTANHTVTEHRAAGATVTVIDREEIERRGEATVLELLRDVPGLELVQGGGGGRLASVFLRGGSSAQTLVLIDGVRVSSPADGAFDFAALTTAGIERVEVLRGPQSGLYGSEAMGGVIAIYTREGVSQRRVNLDLEGGSRDWRRASLDLSARHDRLRYSLAASHVETAGVSAAAESAGNTERDGWQNASVAARAGWDFTSGGSLDVTLRRVEDESEFDTFAFDGTSFRPSDDPNSLQQRDMSIASLSLRRPLGRRWSQRVDVGLRHEALEGLDPDSPFQRFRFDSEVLQAGTRADLALTAHQDLSLGLAWEERAMENRGSFDESVTLGSAYGQYRAEWTDVLATDRLFFTTALRLDEHSTFGDELTWRLTAAGLRGSSRLHASWGTGFRAPTFFDLFSPFGANPDLAPETSEGVDIGIEHEIVRGDGDGDGRPRLTVGLILFYTAYRDLIVLDELFVPQNVSRASSRGAEVTLGTHLTDELRLHGSYTWTDTEDDATGLPLPRRPEHRATLTLDQQATSRLSSHLSAVTVAERLDTGGQPMDDYLRLDLLLRYQLSQRLAPFVRVDNLLDADYEELPGFTTPGRSAFAGIRLAL